ncbi:preprotein translocase subunit YajC [Cellulomonas fimi]|uniref:Preprotein translocase, YajC subunit n=1 Tax=Cellulomonas fimi (strain ATCC 484 / DSM 20113 / JCM 1341 / CCUG 24087 / LMG 16345 / NBRC 15513 / NCIMB 8980 / NCTC 7547 / NRS-133) TaxID=590998 RepID=F4H0B1_CELFA|nr:preprotein translocase subunit YajC [Cellulomonas fimi]AEE46158.1 preprotein translocase, YajC subunit [Cellulomonas fimi ATCC 484]NNH07055.1 preprotein translocase subunit YajC [Cellulomonas fimi]VEH31866.1 preprotein translocase subunit YajC [Cellulomonas fimi]
MDPTFLVILLLAFGAFWLMSSRTRKQQREAQDFRNNLAPGDEIMTGSGLFGTVVEVEGDVITVESTPGSRTRWIRAAIAKRVDPPADTAADEDEDEETFDDDATDADRDRAADEVIDVPDDLSSLPPVLRKKDDEPDTK